MGELIFGGGAYSPNYQMQMMLLKPVLCFIQQQEVVESQQMQPNGEQLSIVIGDECVGQAWCNYVCQYSAGVYLQCSYQPRYQGIRSFPAGCVHIPASFFYYKSVFAQFRLGGWVIK